MDLGGDSAAFDSGRSLLDERLAGNGRRGDGASEKREETLGFYHGKIGVK